MITKEQAIDILEKFDFFQGQRAGRELWNDKPYEVQEEDIKTFSRDVAELKAYIVDVAAKSKATREIFKEIKHAARAAIILLKFEKDEKIRNAKIECYTDLIGYIAELKKKYTEV